MLGEALGEEHGQMTGMRVLPSEGESPKTEASFQASGQLVGMEATDMGTYVSVVRPDGTLFGDGQGVSMTADGDVVTWRGQGVGRFTGQGTAVNGRGAIYYQSASAKLTRLNGATAISKFDVNTDRK